MSLSGFVSDALSKSLSAFVRLAPRKARFDGGKLLIACSVGLLSLGCAPKTNEPAPETGASEQGKSCGSRGQAPCAEGEFCDFPESAACGETDAPGSCKPIRPMCTREFAPVCGCDGKTYPTACTAHAASVSVRSTGPCPGDQADAVEASAEPSAP